MFSREAAASSSVLPAAKAGGTSEGFIRFDSPEGVTKALSSESARDYPFSMRRMPQARAGAGAGHSVVVGGLTEHTGEEMLRQHFDAYGEVVGAEIPKPFRGYAFVRFAAAEDMQRVLSQSHSIDGCPVTVIKKPEAAPMEVVKGKGGKSGKAPRGKAATKAVFAEAADLNVGVWKAMQTENRFTGFAAPEESEEVVGKRLEAEEYHAFEAYRATTSKAYHAFERAITQSLSAHETERQSRMSNEEEALLRRTTLEYPTLERVQ
ncbi:hypothetical protein T484DRAFT_1778347 [Baffinella frigidus]|nr:hypothetical protein T484DRAFT_1778347 [Cryptophyta sp. CCMP2293]